MKAARSKWHHYVPKGVLKHFCFSETKIWYYSKNRDPEGICSRDIGRKFRRRHYYSFEDSTGQKTDLLERDFLQVLDSKFAEFVDEFSQILSSGCLPEVDDVTRGFLQQFIYYYTKRNPDFEESLRVYDSPESLVKEAIDKLETRFGRVSSEKKSELLTSQKVHSIYQYARVSSLARTSPDVNSRLSKMSLHFAFPPEKKQFLIGSRPVVRLENRKGGKLGDGTVEVWTPILPKVLMGFVGPIQGVPRFLDIPTNEVRKINRQLFKQSTEIAGANKVLLESVVSPR